jgi:hypothetical protein
MAAFHEAGIVHGDFYLSNFMWRIQNNEVDLKVIDWDSAFFLSQPLPDRVYKRLETTHRNHLLASLGESGAGVLDSYFVDLLVMNIDLPNFQKSDKLGLDEAFRNAQAELKTRLKLEDLSLETNEKESEVSGEPGNIHAYLGST